MLKIVASHLQAKYTGGFAPCIISGWPGYPILGGFAVLALVVRVSGRQAPERVPSQAV
ncbi:MAG: hypothetical protein LAO20_03160 [Acidobacteriia bacterium]|nr:hypothetical protein [Terriglobia bacterium]